MKNIILNSICLFVMILFNHSGYTQTSILGNNSINPAHYTGWDAGVSFDLNVRHLGDRNINFGTNGVDRMRVASYGNVGVGTGTGTIRPKFRSSLTNANASTVPFSSLAIQGHNRFSAIELNSNNHYLAQTKNPQT